MAPTRPYEIGTRVRLSALGKSRMLRGSDRRGSVVGFGRTGAVVRVLFEEFKHPVSLHQSYLQCDERRKS